MKGLGGRGRLTKAIIDKLQNYYGIAVRTNVGNLNGMKKDIHAALFHVASSAKDNYHTHCPNGPDSWCGFKRDKENYKPGPGLQLDVIKHVKPIFIDLSQESLLEKCLDGKTQNQNESFNNLIWERVPKANFVGFNALETAVYDAVAQFNCGRKSVIDIYEKLGIKAGHFTQNACMQANRERLRSSARRSLPENKKRRQILRGKKKAKADKQKETEGKLYGAGAF